MPSKTVKLYYAILIQKTPLTATPIEKQKIFKINRHKCITPFETTMLQISNLFQ